MTCRKFLTFVDRHTKKFGSGFQLSKKALKTAYIALKKMGGGGVRQWVVSQRFR